MNVRLVVSVQKIALDIFVEHMPSTRVDVKQGTDMVNGTPKT